MHSGRRAGGQTGRHSAYQHSSAQRVSEAHSRLARRAAALNCIAPNPHPPLAAPALTPPMQNPSTCSSSLAQRLHMSRRDGGSCSQPSGSCSSKVASSVRTGRLRRAWTASSCSQVCVPAHSRRRPVTPLTMPPAPTLAWLHRSTRRAAAACAATGASVLAECYSPGAAEPAIDKQASGGRCLCTKRAAAAAVATAAAAAPAGQGHSVAPVPSQAGWVLTR